MWVHDLRRDSLKPIDLTPWSFPRAEIGGEPIDRRYEGSHKNVARDLFADVSFDVHACAPGISGGLPDDILCPEYCHRRRYRIDPPSPIPTAKCSDCLRKFRFPRVRRGKRIIRLQQRW